MTLPGVLGRAGVPGRPLATRAREACGLTLDRAWAATDAVGGAVEERCRGGDAWGRPENLFEEWREI